MQRSLLVIDRTELCLKNEKKQNSICRHECGFNTSRSLEYY